MSSSFLRLVDTECDHKPRVAVIIGAGPAGLTAAYELLTRTDVVPIVLEKSSVVGGLARSENYKGNRIDIGPHRFFSKSDRVMDWWTSMLPLERGSDSDTEITYQAKSRTIPQTSAGPDPSTTDDVLLVRDRTTRIYFLRKFFDYPIRLSAQTLRNLGGIRTIRIGASYLASMMRRRDEKSLEDFFINRFGGELYRTFFKSYTEKVWGVRCRDISAEWGAQRVKGLSILAALKDCVNKLRTRHQNLAQKDTETSLVERFLYPKLGAGQMWETAAEKIVRLGGRIVTNIDVVSLETSVDAIVAVRGIDKETGEERRFESDFVFSSMPVQELIPALDADVPADVREISDGLVYRDLIVVGLLLKRMATTEGDGRCLPDNWIYIQDGDVQAGRLQICNNMSPYLVADPEHIWIGAEYFCNKIDPIWSNTDEEIVDLAAGELAKIGLIDRTDIVDAVVYRVEKSYPAYFGAYDRFDTVREYLDRYENLFLVGRNGMHKYNNQDHSMLTAMVAVDQIAAASASKADIWAVNTEQEYHEQKKAA